MTKKKIRKAMKFARGFFLALFGICALLVIISVDGPSIWFPLVCAVVGIICFGIAYAIDYLLWETSFNGDNSSPFYH